MLLSINMLSVANKTIMLISDMLSVAVLSVVVLSVSNKTIMLIRAMLRVAILSVVMLKVVTPLNYAVCQA